MSRPLIIALLAVAVATHAFAQAPAEKKGPMLLDLKKILPAPAPAPVEAPPPAPMPEPEKKVEVVETPQQRFARTKAKADNGDTQAQYEVGMAYAQEFDRAVPLDLFEALAWFQKAADKNHRLAQHQLARYYELGRGMEKKNLTEALRWRRSSALLGCKMSQRWMNQMYVNVFQGSQAYDDIVEKDPSNLVEAYAWACLAADKTLLERPAAGTPTAAEIAAGHPMIQRDYEFEVGANAAAERDRDGIARNPKFSKQSFEEAKLRAVALQKEAEAFQKANKPK